ncbi:MAG: DUF6746 family protein [Alphaproteobacteria bacterium]
MNKFLIIAGVSAFALAMPIYAMAEDAHKDEVHHTQEHGHDHDHDHGDEAEHYEAIDVQTSEQAFSLLDEKTAVIADVLKKEEALEFLELESIHEVTYTLEAAVDKIRADNAADSAKIDTLDEAVQAIHYASENQEEAKVRTWFVKLQASVSAIKQKSEDVKPEKKAFYEIVIKDHKFSPEEITVPAGEKIKLIIDNQDPTPEEFESHDMNREKIIGGNKKAIIFVGPLKPGKYHFFGEFNMKTANGYVIAK